MSEQQKYLSYEGLQEYDAQIKKYIDQDVSTMHPDWDQNDESASDYIKNRPFYDDTESGGELKQLDMKFIPVASNDEVIDMLFSLDIVNTVSDESGNVLTDESENILLW